MDLVDFNWFQLLRCHFSSSKEPHRQDHPEPACLCVQASVPATGPAALAQTGADYPAVMSCCAATYECGGLWQCSTSFLELLNKCAGCRAARCQWSCLPHRITAAGQVGRLCGARYERMLLGMNKNNIESLKYITFVKGFYDQLYSIWAKGFIKLSELRGK